MIFSIKFHFSKLKKILNETICQKCRLYGSMQIQGLGATLKTILRQHGCQLGNKSLQKREFVALLHATRKTTDSMVTMLNFETIFDSESAEICAREERDNMKSMSIFGNIEEM